MNIIVFLGPTLPKQEAQSILDAEYYPPVMAGAVLEVMAKKPRAILIIDGFFRNAGSVRHKEILYALSQGVHVYGSSSMGALRAAELCDFGMQGVGKIFEAFRDGKLVADDEVAVAHSSEEMDYQNFSEAMVNIREGLAKAVQKEILSAGQSSELIRISKERFYVERSWPKVFEDAQQIGIPHEKIGAFRNLIEQDKPNVKRDDAIKLLRLVAQHSQKEMTENIPKFFLYASGLYRRWALGIKFLNQSGFSVYDSISLDLAIHHVLAFSKNRKKLLQEAGLLFQFFLQAIGKGLLKEHPLQNWGDELEDLCHQLSEESKRRVRDIVPLALMRQNSWESNRNKILKIWRGLRDRGCSDPTYADAGIDEADLFDWYRRKTNSEVRNIGELAAELSADEPEDVRKMLLAEYLFDKNG